jgi:hypothetical protein
MADRQPQPSRNDQGNAQQQPAKAKRQGKRRSRAWTIYTEVDEAGHTAKCPFCGEVISTLHQTSSMWDHLARAHQMVRSTNGELLPAAQTPPQPPQPTMSQHLQNQINQAVLRFLVLDLQPFTVVESEAFRQILRIATGGACTFMSRATAATLVAQEWRLVKAKVLNHGLHLFKN